MNRIEFMETLSGLLMDIPEEDRIDALKYYNDYFDDAGSENEQKVIEELESPEKVAMKIKADREDTYKDEKDNKIYQDNGTYDYEESRENKPWTNKWLKWAMIIAIVVIGFPIVIPLGIGLLALIAGIVIAVFCVFAAIVIAFVAVAVVGIMLFAMGIGCLFANPGVALGVFGTGLIVMVIGIIGTVIGVRLCMIVFPGIVRGIVYILRKPFHRKAVA